MGRNHNMKWTIELDGTKLCQDKETAHAYLQEVFSFADYYGKNLDALHDCLSEIHLETEICLDQKTLVMMAEGSYSYRILTVMFDTALENPYLKFRLKR